MLPVYATQAGDASWRKQDLPVLIYLGMFGVTLNQLFFVVGLSMTSVAHSALIIAMTPIFVLAIAALIKQERITWRKAAGMLIAFAGVGMLNAIPASAGPPASQPSVLGDVFVTLAAVTFSLFTVLGKQVSLRHSSVTVNTFAYVGGALALIPVVIWQGRNFSYGMVSLTAWSSVLYMALFPSVIAYLIYYHALAHMTASRVSAFSYLQPVFATIMGVVILGESLGAPVIAGGTAILTGVYMAERG
jgi:drug/metabolite transporter (DMT)-like permease